MKDIIHFGIEKTNPDIVIIDSLSQLINFSKPTDQELNEFYTFLRDMRQQMVNLVNKTYIFMFDTKMGVLYQFPTQGFDTILKLEAITPIINSQKSNLLLREKSPLSPVIS
jgi:archaellum biogenesis ATPase FlaH